MNIYLVKNKEELSTILDDRCWIVGSNGIFLKVENLIGTAVIPVSKMEERPGTKEDYQVPGLLKIETSLVYSIPKIPKELMVQIVDFFREVYNQKKAEAIVLLFMNKKTKEYKITCPKQKVGGASVSYDNEFSEKNFLRAGTIHSHNTMSSFQSGTDFNDEAINDGIHITVGKIENITPDFHTRISFSGVMFEIKDPFKLIEWPQPREIFPSEWLEMVEEHKYTSVVSHNYMDLDEISFNSKQPSRTKTSKPTFMFLRNIRNRKSILRFTTNIR